MNEHKEKILAHIKEERKKLKAYANKKKKPEFIEETVHHDGHHGRFHPSK